MTCPDCQTAQARPWHGFRANCKGCQVRALTRSDDYLKAKHLFIQTAAYRAALKSLGVSHKTAGFVAGIDLLGSLTHAQVLEAAKTDRVRG